MAGASISDYWASVEAFCALCRRAIPEHLVSFIVVGSLSVGDAVPGWSDVDAYLIVKETSDPVKAETARLQGEVTRRYPFLATDRGSRFTVFVVSEGDALRGGEDVSFLAQWDMKRHGVVVCGKDLPAVLGDPPLDRAWLARHTDWMIDYLAGERDAPDDWKGRNAIGFILSGARVAVLRTGLYAKRKEDIAKAFTRLHPGRAKVVEDAMEARRDWPRVRKDPAGIAALYEEAAGFLRWVRTLP